ncbi:hypothetical protein BGZ76_004248, partial [Entomortierella beljakovae]
MYQNPHTQSSPYSQSTNSPPPIPQKPTLPFSQQTPPPNHHHHVQHPQSTVPIQSATHTGQISYRLASPHTLPVVSAPSVPQHQVSQTIMVQNSIPSHPQYIHQQSGIGSFTTVPSSGIMTSNTNTIMIPPASGMVKRPYTLLPQGVGGLGSATILTGPGLT